MKLSWVFSSYTVLHAQSLPQGLSLGIVKSWEREQDLKVQDVTKSVVKGRMKEKSNGGGDCKAGKSVIG